MVRLYPPEAFAWLKAIPGIVAHMTHLHIIVKFCKDVIGNPQVFKQRFTLAFHFNYESWSVGYPDMCDAVVVAPPTNFRMSTRLPENHVHTINCSVTHSLKDAIADRNPSILLGVLNLYAKTVCHYVRKGVWMKRGSYLDFAISRCHP